MSVRGLCVDRDDVLDDSGWAWFIPLHDSTTSVGVVVNQERYRERCKAPPGTSMVERYREMLSHAPRLIDLIGSGTLVAKPSEGEPASANKLVRSASDFSYSAPAYAGNNFRIVGDAGGALHRADNTSLPDGCLQRSLTRSSRRASTSP